MLPAVILVQPREEGNVGAVARAMANMGLERLILVEPAPAIGGVARGFGVGGWDLLDRIERAMSFSEAIAPFRRVVGTTSARARPKERSRLLPVRELPAALAADPPETATALVFGPEDNGLSRRQLEVCHPVVAVPCARRQPTLNLAQSVLIVAYELHLGRDGPGRDRPASNHRESALNGPAAAAEVDALLAQLARLLYRVGYDQPAIRRRLTDGMRRLLRRSDATPREVRVLRRILNRIAKAIGSRGTPPAKPAGG